MRIVFFSFLFLFSVSTAVAQDQNLNGPAKEVKVETLSFSIATVVPSNFSLEGTNATAGIFVMKNSRVKRALSFKVKTRNPKLA
ncbi:hypothetical protein ACFQZJ_12250 [Maribacter chungangensis]|uniref:Uncharacterized protein n=1 Tax=Maribacter chungangensis TaxID=1069117 RepID=A0ABW3B5F1_9FLAO